MKPRSVLALQLLLLFLSVLDVYCQPGFSQDIECSIVLISIDTCRADHLSCYGYHRDTTPNIDAVAEEGVLFANAVSPVPITLPSHSSMLSGTIPPYHGVHDNANYKLGSAFTTLAELLQDQGYATAAFVIPACAVGAWHRRDRVFIIAYSGSERYSCDVGFSGTVISGIYKEEIRSKNQFEFESINGPVVPAKWKQEKRQIGPRSLLFRNDDGIPFRMDRITRLGNAVVPQVSWMIGELIKEWYEKRD